MHESVVCDDLANASNHKLCLESSSRLLYSLHHPIWDHRTRLCSIFLDQDPTRGMDHYPPFSTLHFHHICLALRKPKKVPIRPTQQSPHEYNPHPRPEPRDRQSPWDRSNLHRASKRCPSHIHSLPHQLTSVLPSGCLYLLQNRPYPLHTAEGTIPYRPCRSQNVQDVPLHNPNGIQRREQRRRRL